MENANALTELAKELKCCLNLQPQGSSYYHDRTIFCTPQVIDKAQRIVAALAKVGDVGGVHNLEPVKSVNSWEAIDAIVKCRAIAEEGDGDGK